MILSNECWIRDICKKSKLPYAECNNSDTFCIKLFKLNELYTLSLLPKNRWVKEVLRLDESRVDEQAFDYLISIQNNIESFVNAGQHIYIYSSITGNGKTSFAIRLLQTYLNTIWYKCDISCKGLFINVPKYLLSIKDNITQYNEYANHIKNNVLTADLVVWDDIGTKSATSFEHENLLSIIDDRVNNNKSNIFTSNISPQELQNLTGDRLYSRIINLSNCVEFKGVDKRSLNKINI